MNPITMLKNDHQKVSRLFQEHSRARGAERKKAIFERIHAELSIHAELEEQVFYPAVRETSSKGEETVREGYEEHAEVKTLLSEIAALEADDDEYEQKFAELRAGVEHHVDEEEGEMLPEAEKSLGQERLRELGTEMQEMKQAMQGVGMAGRMGPRSASAGSRSGSSARKTSSRSGGRSASGGRSTGARKTTSGRSSGRTTAGGRSSARKTAGRKTAGRKTAGRKTAGRTGSR